MPNVSATMNTKFNSVTTISTKVPSGFVVREKVDNEGETISLELGCYVEDSIFVSVPVNKKMKYQFIKLTECDKEKGFNYYAIPNDTAFAIEEHISKKTNKKYPVLRSAKLSDVNEQIFLTCVAIGANMSVLSMELSENITVLKRFIDKERRYVAFIGFVPYKDISNMSVKFRDGIQDTKIRYTESVITMTPHGVETNIDTVNPTDVIKSEYIGFKLWGVENPKRVENTETVDVEVNTSVAPKTDTDNTYVKSERKYIEKKSYGSENTDVKQQKYKKSNYNKKYSGKNKDKTRRNNKFN